MPKVVGIKFKKTPKIYYFAAEKHNFALKDGVIVETARGLEYGTVAMLPFDVEDDKIVGTLKPIVRIATKEDKAKHERLEARRLETMKIASAKIEKSGLNMKLVDVKFTFDEQKLILYFTSESRVDFRELVRDLASVFHVRIELRQIGSRDECKMMGGLGVCGRPCCCSDCNLDYPRVTIKMAKNQGLALNPGKINGLCGNLMCCLEYENEYYSEVNKLMPKIGSEVTLPDESKGTVASINHLKKTVTVKIQGKEDVLTFTEYPLEQIKFKTKNGESEGEDKEAQ